MDSRSMPGHTAPPQLNCILHRYETKRVLECGFASRMGLRANTFKNLCLSHLVPWNSLQEKDLQLTMTIPSHPHMDLTWPSHSQSEIICKKAIIVWGQCAFQEPQNAKLPQNHTLEGSFSIEVEWTSGCVLLWCFLPLETVVLDDQVKQAVRQHLSPAWYAFLPRTSVHLLDLGAPKIHLIHLKHLAQQKLVQVYHKAAKKQGGHSKINQLEVDLSWNTRSPSGYLCEVTVDKPKDVTWVVLVKEQGL